MSGMFGPSKAQKRAMARQEQQQAEALQLQKRQMRSAEEEAARARAEGVSGRMLRGAGRRALAFAGRETGLATSLAG